MPLSAQALSELEQWVAQYGAALAGLDAATRAAVIAAYAEIEDWSDTAQTLAAAAVAVRVAQAGQQSTAGLSAQYAAVVMALLGDRSQSPIVPDLLRLLQGRRNVTPFNLYSRPIHVYRRVIARGGTPAEAFAAARLRAEVIAGLDGVLTAREATLIQFRAEGALRYRRVIRPELSQSGTCGLCVAASDRVYTTDKLMPIHERCKCIPMPVTDALDPGFRLNFDDLKRLYADAGDNTAAALKRTRYRIENHGELGPILVDALHPQRGFADADAA